MLFARAEKALRHLRRCQLITPLSPVQLPMLSYKGNMACLHNEGPSGFVGTIPDSLDKFSWRAASASPLVRFLAGNTTFRDTLATSHMNIGSGVHMSSMADPVERWFKSIGTQHGMQNLEMRKSFPVWMIKAGLRGEITYAMVKSVSGGFDSCTMQKNSQLEKRSGLLKSDYDFVVKTLPWALQNNPRRYPFIMGNG